MKKNNYFSLEFENDKFVFLDQTKLPLEEEYVETDDYNRIAEAIERLEVRGAPLIGVSAAYALALSLKKVEPSKFETTFQQAFKRIEKTRPTAVNLFMALDEMKKVYYANSSNENLYEILLNKAKEIHQDDIYKCKKIGENGLKILKQNLLSLRIAIPVNLQPPVREQLLMLLKPVSKIT